MTFKNTKGIYGVGINDAGYDTQVEGKHCPFYLKWKTMLLRVYKKPYDCYKDTEVCDEWLKFSNFKAWMEAQDWKGKVLDKDLLGDGNLYSPETCCFIGPKINSFLASEKKQGKYLRGVSKSYNRYFSRCSNPFTGKREFVGRFNCEVAAYVAYKAKKLEYAIRLSEGLEEPLAKALVNKYKLGNGPAGALDFDLESYTLKPVEPLKAPIVSRKDDF